MKFDSYNFVNYNQWFIFINFADIDIRLRVKPCLSAVFSYFEGVSLTTNPTSVSLLPGLIYHSYLSSLVFNLPR